jgi:hypothetical protein
MRLVALCCTDIAARRIDKRGIQFLSVTPAEGETFTPAQRLGNEALTVSSWAAVWLLLTMAIDRLPLPSARRRSASASALMF